VDRRREAGVTSPAADVVLGFVQAWSEGDFAAARLRLHEDVAFQGPFDDFDSAEPYLAALQRLHGVVERAEIRRLFVDGDEACLLYDLVTRSPAGTALICEWMQVRSGRIASIRAVFDARPFAAMFAAG